MKHEILIAGYGGQGIMLAGNILAQAAMEEGKEVTIFPSYGAEMRGGTAKCFIIISDHKIGSPVITKPSIKVILNQASFDKYVDAQDEDAIVIYNSSIITTEYDKGQKVAATEIAQKLGDVRAANIILLGVLTKFKEVVKINTIENVVKKVFQNKKEVLEINLKALHEIQ